MRVTWALILTPLLLAQTAATPPAALAGLQPGRWVLSSPSAPPRELCIGDPRVLIQLQHRASACSRYVLDNQPNLTTVHYTCPGAGHGQTTIRVETPRLAQIDTQGIAGRAPFALSLEARRVGDCGAAAAR